AAAVTAAARETPEDRIRKNLDQRIAAARDKCSADEGSCNTGCMGVAALGILSLFSGSSAGTRAATEQTQQCSNRCTDARSACDQQVTALEGGSTGTVMPSRSGMAFEDCQRQENASGIGRKLEALPANSVNLQTRGIIAAADFMIQTYSQCLPDRRAQQVVDQYRTIREQTLRTCRQSSATDNCLSPPFAVAPAPAPSAAAYVPPPANTASSEVCTRADGQTSKRIQVDGSMKYCACIGGVSYDAMRCSCLTGNPNAPGCR
ncbi:MAG: hypothetical protein WCK07_18660, partial [Betaproteobacteria bacterium]